MILLNVCQFMSNHTSLGWQVAFKGIIQRSIQNNSAIEATRLGIGLASGSGSDLKRPDKKAIRTLHIWQISCNPTDGGFTKKLLTTRLINTTHSNSGLLINRMICTHDSI